MTMGGRGALLVAALVAATASAGSAQERCSEVDQVGSLGITGIACERCRFFTNGGYHSAVFWTEPEVRSLTAAARAAGALREGDVLVAVDGALITTGAGHERFSNLPREGTVPVRVRRNGQTLDVDAPVTPVCAVDQAPRPPSVSGRPVPTAAAPPRPPTPDPAASVRPPTPPRTSAAQTPRLPRPPRLASLPAAPLPGVTLGFGFRCESCYRNIRGSEIVWRFQDLPEVTGVQPDGPASSSGLRVGDRLVAIDGRDLLSDEGGRRFGSILPDTDVVWTVEREGRRLDITSRARARTPAVDAPISEVLRFSGRVGDAFVEVRGEPATVVNDEEGRLLIIRTAGNEIIVRLPGG